MKYTHPIAICCGQKAVPYRKVYYNLVIKNDSGKKVDLTPWEMGFTCKKCGRVRIPVESNNNFAAESKKYHDEMDSLREKALLEENYQ